MSKNEKNMEKRIDFCVNRVAEAENNKNDKIDSIVTSQLQFREFAENKMMETSESLKLLQEAAAELEQNEVKTAERFYDLAKKMKDEREERDNQHIAQSQWNNKTDNRLESFLAVEGVIGTDCQFSTFQDFVKSTHTYIEEKRNKTKTQSICSLGIENSDKIAQLSETVNQLQGTCRDNAQSTDRLETDMKDVIDDLKQRLRETSKLASQLKESYEKQHKLFRGYKERQDLLEL